MAHGLSPLFAGLSALSLMLRLLLSARKWPRLFQQPNWAVWAGAVCRGCIPSFERSPKTAGEDGDDESSYVHSCWKFRSPGPGKNLHVLGCMDSLAVTDSRGCLHLNLVWAHHVIRSCLFLFSLLSLGCIDLHLLLSPFQQLDELSTGTLLMGQI